MLHSTRGGTSHPQTEYLATQSWFANPRAEVSAHVIVSADGELCACVDAELIAWHAREYNAEWLGLELCQAHLGDAITDAQYSATAWWLIAQANRFGFELTDATLAEHREIPPGIRDGKTDVSAPFDRAVLLDWIRRWRSSAG